MGRTLIDFANGKLRAYIPGGFTFVSVSDMVEGHILAMEKGRRGQKYIFSTAFLTVDELMSIFEEVTGRKRPSLRLPPPLMAGIAEVSSFFLTNFFPNRPQRFTPAAVRFLRMQRKADCSKARNELGYEPTSIAQAVRDAYACFVRRGLIVQRGSGRLVSQRRES
jgi:nucleoside-diphosphate-sugar epimerase